MKSVSQRLNSTNGEESRKAPLPRFKLKASADEIARQLWEDSLQAILLQGRPSRASTGILEEEGSFKGLHQTEEDQQAAEKAAADTSALSARVSELVAQLHQLLAEDEAAVDAAAEGVSKLSWEQIQTVQVVLDDLHDDLLSDFVHIVAFHTSRPFVRVAVGADSEGWQREMEEKRGAERAGRERRRRERQARNAAQAALALAEHAQKAKAQEELQAGQQQEKQHVSPELEVHAKILAGRHWRPRASDARAEKAAAAAAADLPGHNYGATAIPADGNAWQRASRVAIAGSRRGSVMARSSMARNRQSMTAAMATAAQAAAADASAHASMPEDPAGPGRGTHAQSYTGLAYSTWHTAVAAPATSAVAALPSEAQGTAEGADPKQEGCHGKMAAATPGSTARRFSDVYWDRELHKARPWPPLLPAAPSALDAVFLAKVSKLNMLFSAEARA